MIKLHVGLGNPVKLLEYTRHNVGYIVIDNILSSVHNTRIMEIDGLYKLDEDNYVMKPQCSINDSFKEIKKAMDFLGLDVDEVGVFYDEMDLVLGAVDVKANNMYIGGNKPILFIQSEIGNVLRYPIGVGKCHDHMSKFDFVLGNFMSGELKTINKSVQFMADEVLSLVL